MSSSSRGEMWRPLLDGFQAFRVAWPKRGWTWDGRLVCMASTFSVREEPEARVAATRVLPNVWTEKSLPTASQALRDLALHYGGVRSGQLLLTADRIGDVLPFGLWWPWGNAETISLRVGLFGIDEAQPPFPDFRAIFDAAAN